MTQEHFENLTATLAAGLAPMLVQPGHVVPDTLAELTKTAVDLAVQIAKHAGERYRAANGVF
jgi:hypothetical protein